MADSSFQQEFLETHNAYRAKHNTPPMTLSSELTASAQKWADHLLANNTLEHRQMPDGENLYNMCSSTTIKLTGKEAVDSWYGEIKDYNWGNPGFSGQTGHFTQVVWKDSTELGVGMATNGNKVFVVGQYRPAGNMNRKEYFEQNVLPQGTGWYSGEIITDGQMHHGLPLDYADHYAQRTVGLWLHSLLVTVWLYKHQMDFLAQFSGEQPNRLGSLKDT
ncbi:Golgi-associated plant pathogenesis-related protein 1-like [Centropristis striata]|uniref:Golgi-associated plant pathogenesis-related protein 1-like n=1 Tax=Centropristis striata TaxID=184440 RepID=UPI0027E0954A|nr:Golgi-associated plant pathogenesis-related protein 1-like [Centropristis striata]